MVQSLGIDVGGTFTDLYAFDSVGSGVSGKAPTTPDDPVIGVMNAVEESGVDLSGVSHIVHGSTIATNAVIERNLPAAALLTTKGFRDLIEIGRYHKKKLYDPYQFKPEPLIPRKYRFEVSERLDSLGNVVEELDEDEARDVANRIVREGIRNVAVGFMNSYMNPTHEDQMAKILKEAEPELNVSLSSRILPRIRPLGRFITTIINASLKPLTADYVAQLETELERAGFRGDLWLIQSNGGIVRANEAVEGSEALLLSGPAAGVVGTAQICAKLGLDNGITMDMGGTSCDVSLIEGATPTTTNESEIDWDMPVPVPMVDITTIGAGGGSLAWVDSHGVLKVGPRSAGADPGPVFYGRGNEQPTVSDADLVLGYIDPNTSLAGRVEVDADAAHRAVSAIGDKLEISDAVEIARGIVTIANQNMANAIAENLVKRGRDPRQFALVAFGGAGPLHAANIAKSLSIPKVVIPQRSSIFSAHSANLLDARHEIHGTYLRNIADVDESELDALFQSLEDRGQEILEREGFVSIKVKRYAELRYVGQSYELEITVPTGQPDSEKIAENFVSEHERIYGVKIPNTPITLVNLRISAIGEMERPTLSQEGCSSGKRSTGGVRDETREVFFLEEGDAVLADVFDGNSLHPGDSVEGPALVELENTTVLIEPSMEAEVDMSGNIIISTGGG